MCIYVFMCFLDDNGKIKADITCIQTPTRTGSRAGALLAIALQTVLFLGCVGPERLIS